MLFQFNGKQDLTMPGNNSLIACHTSYKTYDWRWCMGHFSEILLFYFSNLDTKSLKIKQHNVDPFSSKPFLRPGLLKM